MDLPLDIDHSDVRRIAAFLSTLPVEDAADGE
jgi:hypothetical protein